MYMRFFRYIDLFKLNSIVRSRRFYDPTLSFNGGDISYFVVSSFEKNCTSINALNMQFTAP